MLTQHCLIHNEARGLLASAIAPAYDTVSPRDLLQVIARPLGGMTPTLTCQQSADNESHRAVTRGPAGHIAGRRQHFFEIIASWVTSVPSRGAIHVPECPAERHATARAVTLDVTNFVLRALTDVVPITSRGALIEHNVCRLYIPRVQLLVIARRYSCHASSLGNIFRVSWADDNGQEHKASRHQPRGSLH